MRPYRKPAGLLSSGSDQFRVIASGLMTPAGVSGSEYATINMTTTGAAVGDFMFMYVFGGNGVNSNGSVDQNGAGGAWTTEAHAWAHSTDGALAYKTLAAGDVAATALRILVRSTYPVCYVIIRSNSGSTTGTVKQKLTGDTGTSPSLTFAGYTKAGASKGHLMMVFDRDAAATWTQPAGHNKYQTFVAGGVFASAVGDLRNPAGYTSLASLVWTTTGVTFGGAGFIFEIT